MTPARAGGATTYTLTETRELTLDQYVGLRVRTLREARGWSMLDLSHALGGRSPSGWLSTLETGQKSMRLGTLQRLANALGVAPRELLP